MTLLRKAALAFAGIALLASGAASAQVQAIDPNAAIDGDLRAGAAPAARAPAAPTASAGATFAPPEAGTIPALPADTAPRPSLDVAGPPPAVASTSLTRSIDCGQTGAPQVASATGAAPATGSTTYREDDLVGAAEGVFGKGAKGLAEIIHDLLRKQGEPNGYITGREAGGAFAIGLRYGSGTLCHRIEGKRPVYWTGPSIGFDAGASGGSTFVLVYNLYDTQDIYKRFGAGEGQAYLIGGFNVSYLRRGDVVLIPIRMGVGLRLGINAGYMKFSHKQNWFPF